MNPATIVLAGRRGPAGCHMNKRPLSVTIVSWLFIGAGTVGLTYHATHFKALNPFDYELLGICLIRLLAIVFGAFMLRGRNWARWGAVVWIGYHVGLSVLHTLSELLMHSLLFAGIAYFLFRSRASAYFGGTTGNRTESESAVK